MIWEKISPLRPQLYSENCIKTMENGNSMRLDAAIRVVWQLCVRVMEWK